MTIAIPKPTVLVTGSEGSIASWIIRHYLKDYNVVGVDNCSRYGKKIKTHNYTFEQGDLCDFSWTEHVFSKYKPKFVLHTAAQIYGVVGFHKFSADILGSNTTSVHSLLSAAVKYDTKKVAYLSSSMVYERCITIPFNEQVVDSLPCPQTGYGLSKLYGEKLLKEYNKQYGLNFVIWRPFNVVTPLERYEKEYGIAHVIPDMIRKIAIEKSKTVEIFGNGTQIRCFTWVDNVAKTINDYSWNSVTDCEVFNLGSEEPISINDLSKLIWRKTRPTEQFSAAYIDSYKDDVLVRIPDCSKARTMLNWKHEKTIDNIIDICLGEMHGPV